MIFQNVGIGWRHPGGICYVDIKKKKLYSNRLYKISLILYNISQISNTFVTP